MDSVHRASIPNSGIVQVSSKTVVGKLFSAVTRRVMGTVTHVSTQEPVAALTFDDGPHPEFTPRLLEILQKHGARATFFMVGRSAERQPALVQQVVQAGHAIGNHSYDHPSFPLISSRERRIQVRSWQQVVGPAGQRLFRPPYGHQSPASRLDLLRLGYQVVTWNVVAQDWLDHDAGWLTDLLMRKVRPGSIVLLHDALFDAEVDRYWDRTATLEAVGLVLAHFADRLKFVTVPELFQYGRRQYRNWYEEPDLNWLNQLKRQEGETRQYRLT